MATWILLIDARNPGLRIGHSCSTVIPIMEDRSGDDLPEWAMVEFGSPAEIAGHVVADNTLALLHGRPYWAFNVDTHEVVRGTVPWPLPILSTVGS